MLHVGARAWAQNAGTLSPNCKLPAASDGLRGRYDCPGERQLQLSYHTAAPLPPAEASWKPRLMTLLGVVGPLTYMALVLALGIFR